MGFARTDYGLEFALVQDGTGKTAAEIHDMGRWNRYLTAMLRARYYREKNRTSGRAKDRM